MKVKNVFQELERASWNRYRLASTLDTIGDVKKFSLEFPKRSQILVIL